MTSSSSRGGGCLLLGIGNVLMGDEGVGVHAVRMLDEIELPGGVSCLDGGTGGLHLLEALQSASRIVLVDATIDGSPAGTIRRLTPRYSKDYPPTLTAHDIGLKDLLDTLYLLGNPPEVVLYAISIDTPGGLDLELSPAIRALLPRIRDRVLDEIEVQPSSVRSQQTRLWSSGAQEQSALPLEP